MNDEELHVCRVCGESFLSKFEYECHVERGWHCIATMGTEARLSKLEEKIANLEGQLSMNRD